MKHFKNILFDLDGTLLDSDSAHTAAFNDTLNEFDLSDTPTFNYNKFSGKPTKEVFMELFPTQEESVINCLTKIKQKKYREQFHNDKLSLLPGAGEFLCFLRSRFLKLFLVTGASKESVNMFISYFNITFQGIVCADDVKNGKPAPDPYALCISKFNLEKTSCLAIEDSFSGVLSAKQAGLKVLCIGDASLSAKSDYFSENLLDAIELF